MKYKATPGNAVIEVVNEALTSSAGLILAGSIQKLIVRSISESEIVKSGDQVEIQPHQFRTVKLGDGTVYLFGPISGIQAVIEESV